MERLVGRFFEGIASWVFPRMCVSCAAEGDLLCAMCTVKVSMPPWKLLDVREGIPVYSKISYKDIFTQRLLHAWKYIGDSQAGMWWKRWITAGNPPCDGPYCFVPIPLSRNSYAERGFNQAQELACELARVYGGSVVCAIGKRRTKKQAKVQKDLRHTLRDISAFFLTKEASALRKHDGVVILVDDVVTTGSTALSCVDVLASVFPKERMMIWTLAFGSKSC